MRAAFSLSLLLSLLSRAEGDFLPLSVVFSRFLLSFPPNACSFFAFNPSYVFLVQARIIHLTKEVLFSQCVTVTSADSLSFSQLPQVS